MVVCEFHFHSIFQVTQKQSTNLTQLHEQIIGPFLKLNFLLFLYPIKILGTQKPEKTKQQTISSAALNTAKEKKENGCRRALLWG